MKNRGFPVSILILLILLTGLSACRRPGANWPDQITQTGLKDIEWAADTWNKVAESSSAGLADQGSAGLDNGSALTTKSAGLPDNESPDSETTLTVTETATAETAATHVPATHATDATTTETIANQTTTTATTRATRATTTATTVAETRPAATTAPTTAATTTAATTAAKSGGLTAGQWIAEIFRLTNEARTAHGLPPFRPADAALTAAAATRGGELPVLYSHTRPNGESCFSVLAEYGIAWSCTAENIAAASAGYYTPADMVNGWMDSAGHRKNILNPALTTMGVGYGEGNGNEYFVQLFIG